LIDVNVFLTKVNGKEGAGFVKKGSNFMKNGRTGLGRELLINTHENLLWQGYVLGISMWWKLSANFV
jgi:hypothetical protein